MKCKHEKFVYGVRGYTCERCGIFAKISVSKVKEVYKPFTKELVKEYGEQVYRDSKYNGNSLEDNSYSNAAVAEACGEIERCEEEKFRKAILKYAKTTRFPENFI